MQGDVTSIKTKQTTLRQFLYFILFVRISRNEWVCYLVTLLLLCMCTCTNYYKKNQLKLLKKSVKGKYSFKLAHLAS